MDFERIKFKVFKEQGASSLGLRLMVHGNIKFYPLEDLNDYGNDVISSARYLIFILKNQNSLNILPKDFINSQSAQVIFIFNSFKSEDTFKLFEYRTKDVHVGKINESRIRALYTIETTTISGSTFKIKEGLLLTSERLIVNEEQRQLADLTVREFIFLKELIHQGGHISFETSSNVLWEDYEFTEVTEYELKERLRSIIYRINSKLKNKIIKSDYKGGYIIT